MIQRLVTKEFDQIEVDHVASSTMSLGGHTLDPTGPVPTGGMVAWTTSSAPTGWLICDGSAVSRTTYADLYAVVGDTYGSGDGTTTFNLPNIKGRVVVGLDSADAAFDALAETGGSATHTLNTAEIPAHTHTQDAHTHTANSAVDNAPHSHPASTGVANAPHSHNASTGAANAPHSHPASTGAANADHSHGESGNSNGQNSQNYTKRIGGGNNWDVSGASLAAWQSAYYARTVTSYGPHSHPASTGAANAPHSHPASTAAANAPHSHPASTAAANAPHSHTVTVDNATATNQNTGGGGAHNNVQPYIVLNYIIKV